MCKKFTLSLVWKRSISIQNSFFFSSKMVSFAVTKHPGRVPNQFFALSPCVYLGQPVVDIRGLNLWKGYFFLGDMSEDGMSDGFWQGLVSHHRCDFSFISLFLSRLIQKQFSVGNWRNDIKCWTRPTLGSQTIVSLWQSISPQGGRLSAERKAWKKENVGGKGVTKRQRVLRNCLGACLVENKGRGKEIDSFFWYLIWYSHVQSSPASVRPRVNKCKWAV